MVKLEVQLTISNLLRMRFAPRNWILFVNKVSISGDFFQQVSSNKNTTLFQGTIDQRFKNRAEIFNKFLEFQQDHTIKYNIGQIFDHFNELIVNELYFEQINKDKKITNIINEFQQKCSFQNQKLNHFQILQIGKNIIQGAGKSTIQQMNEDKCFLRMLFNDLFTFQQEFQQLQFSISYKLFEHYMGKNCFMKKTCKILTNRKNMNYNDFLHSAFTQISQKQKAQFYYYQNHIMLFESKCLFINYNFFLRKNPTQYVSGFQIDERNLYEMMYLQISEQRMQLTAIKQLMTQPSLMFCFFENGLITNNFWNNIFDIYHQDKFKYNKLFKLNFFQFSCKNVTVGEYMYDFYRDEKEKQYEQYESICKYMKGFQVRHDIVLENQAYFYFLCNIMFSNNDQRMILDTIKNKRINNQNEYKLDSNLIKAIMEEISEQQNQVQKTQCSGFGIFKLNKSSKKKVQQCRIEKCFYNLDGSISKQPIIIKNPINPSIDYELILNQNKINIDIKNDEQEEEQKNQYIPQDVNQYNIEEEEICFLNNDHVMVNSDEIDLDYKQSQFNKKNKQQQNFGFISLDD
ncbi:hypothetical protein TTHERM_00670150 (macronuclear) [Tetrahymena thermophila SB210]|uniref:Uncharacterized protein n=1 Tax=Tetrahymena thermophila (strain SB210) TaxID=312017 RepID=I7MMN4_TETTS|nr:hypothetical protein TTHERM_00670150 [Tetrahymena thermophila SB210]EAS06091.2 hypothetical protein TTHERM_00670150 [Tetrahymena thermophila SB210]|eukprot:XP_001026336.2 hypothetical protein TTHERM_00670150 [Tetrahymena thermophila SB210]